MNRCIVKYDVKPPGNRVVVSVSDDRVRHQHNVEIPPLKKSLRIFGIGSNGSYTREFKLGDYAAYQDQSTYTIKYAKITKIAIETITVGSVECSLFDFANHNHFCIEDEQCLITTINV